MAEFAAAIGATSLDIRRLRLAGNARSMRRLDLDNNSLLTLRKSVASLVRRTLPIRLHLDSSGSKRSRADCPCGKTALTIRDDGAIIICPYNPAILLGNATINPISEVWQAKAGILDQEDTLCGMLGRKKGQ
ncbi:SPASM domain-containing protein [Trueperella sp.]|uniref:SPASM domain-containing protein n=1 Tax=Trueperella sp. TaxID=2699835 RepID=UPI003454CAF3